MGIFDLVRVGALRRVLSNSSWLFLRSGIRLGIGLVAFALLARYLGAESFGRYAYAIAFVMMSVEISSLGLSGIVTHDLVVEPDARDEILGSAFAIRTLGAVLAVVVNVLVIRMLRPGDSEVQLLVAVLALILLVRPFDVIAFFYEARVESRFTVVAKVGAAITYLVFVVAFIRFELSLVWFAVVRVIEAAVTGFGMLAIFVVQGWRPSTWRLRGHRARKMLGQSWPLILSAMGAAIYLRVDQIMLGQMVGDAEVGTYAVASRLSEVWYVVPAVIMSSLFPFLVVLRQSDHRRYELRLQQTMDGLAWLAIGIAILTTLLGPLVVRVLFGAAYDGASEILAVHIWAGVFIFMRAVLSKWLIIERLFIFSLVTHGAGVVTNVGLNLVLIPRLGGLGAAITTVVSYAMASYLALFLHPKTYPAAVMMTRALVAPYRWTMRRPEEPHEPTEAHS